MSKVLFGTVILFGSLYVTIYMEGLYLFVDFELCVRSDGVNNFIFILDLDLLT